MGQNAQVFRHLGHERYNYDKAVTSDETSRSNGKSAPLELAVNTHFYSTPVYQRNKTSMRVTIFG